MKKYWPVVVIAVILVMGIALRQRPTAPPPTPTPVPTPTPTPPRPEALLGAIGPGTRGLWQAGQIEVGVLCVSPPEAQAVFYRGLAFEAARRRVDWKLHEEYHQRFIAWADDGSGVGMVLQGGTLVVFAGDAKEVSRRVWGSDLPDNLCTE